ncbi:hypothetical protein KM043_007330 [Ampulex compressa]|nr:hypothetical protein KM043_007330 [Ampulex compressa]
MSRRTEARPGNRVRTSLDKDGRRVRGIVRGTYILPCRHVCLRKPPVTASDAPFSPTHLSRRLGRGKAKPSCSRRETRTRDAVDSNLDAGRHSGKCQRWTNTHLSCELPCPPVRPTYDSLLPSTGPIAYE